MKVKTKVLKEIKNDDDYCDVWKEVNKLDGRAEALIQVSNMEIHDPLKEAKRADKRRNKLIDLMEKYQKKIN